MDLTAEQFVDQLLTNEALETPSDKGKPEELVLELPEWFDEKKFNHGRRFYWDNCYWLTASMLMGLVAVFAVPSILRVLVGSRRSTSVYTAYRRYLSTMLHTVSWFEHDLKPGSISWRSLLAVRTRHLRAGNASKVKGGHVVSQRDMALTQFGFVGFTILKPDKFGIRQLREGDWEAYNYLWRVIGHMIGLEDRYNMCRKSVEETRQVCQLLLERVYTPCLENVPEHFEHMARVMLDGMWSVNPMSDAGSLLYITKYLADVPGYILTEEDRILLQRRLRKQLNGKPVDTGVDTTTLMSKPHVDGLPDQPPRLLYLRDFETLESSPHYKQLSLGAKFKIGFGVLAVSWYGNFLGRLYFNFNFLYSLFLMKYFPYIAFFRFGVKASLVNMFEEDPTDDTRPKTNSEYYKEKSQLPWYLSWLSVIW